MSSDRKIAFVLGGSDSCWDDLARARELAEPDLIVACNHAGRDYDGIVDHWATMHGELLPGWIKTRRANGLPDARNIWCARHRLCNVDGVRKIKSHGGSSGMLAVTVAIEQGISHAILCGIPMNQNGRHYDDSRKWREASQYLAAWRAYLPIIEGRVKSFGGDTAKMLGMPTREWLDDGSTRTA